MALALNNGYPRVDVESLLFDLKDILRTSLQVNRAQNAEIVRLGGRPLNDLMASEYEERVHVALTQVDAALDVFDSASFDAPSSHYEFDVMAWIQNTNKQLGLTFEDVDAVPVSDQTEVVSVPMTASQDIPVDFWNVHDFKWEDEPLSDDGSGDSNLFSAPVDRDTDKETPAPSGSDITSTSVVGFVPDEQISEIWLDDEYDDHESEWDRSSNPRASNSNFDDSATLYHPEDSSYLSHRRRHTLVGKLAAFVAEDATVASAAHKLHMFGPSPTSGFATPTRPFGLTRTSSAPDLRALRASYDPEEHMLLSAF
jgi:hypothetical protein